MNEGRAYKNVFARSNWPARQKTKRLYQEYISVIVGREKFCCEKEESLKFYSEFSVYTHAQN